MLKELQDARRLVQRTHDIIERFGFNIWHYEAPGYKYGGLAKRGAMTRALAEGDLDRAEEIGYHGTACWIGTFRGAAGIRMDPSQRDASQGDGPELRIALEAADQVAMRVLEDRDVYFRDEVETFLNSNREDIGEFQPGRLIEAVGIITTRQQCGGIDGEQYQGEALDALMLLRDVLRTLDDRIHDAKAIEVGDSIADGQHRIPVTA